MDDRISDKQKNAKASKSINATSSSRAGLMSKTQLRKAMAQKASAAKVISSLLIEVQSDNARVQADALQAIAAIGPTARKKVGPVLFKMMNPRFPHRPIAWDNASLAETTFEIIHNCDNKPIQYLGIRKYSEFLDKLKRLGFLEEPDQQTPPQPHDSRDAVEQRGEHFAALMEALPKDAPFLELAPKLANANHQFRREMAVLLEPALNAHIKAMPHETYEEKKELAKWVNAEVERLGLAVKCPKTGLPATLRGQTGNWRDVGRFAFEVYLDGKRTTPSTSDKLPELELIDATPLQKPEISHQDKVGPKISRRGRTLD